jgi:hypothetical protein
MDVRPLSLKMPLNALFYHGQLCSKEIVLLNINFPHQTREGVSVCLQCLSRQSIFWEYFLLKLFSLQKSGSQPQTNNSPIGFHVWFHLKRWREHLAFYIIFLNMHCSSSWEVLLTCQPPTQLSTNTAFSFKNIPKPQ